MERKNTDGTIASLGKRVHAIALCTGYGENTSVSWTFFTHHVGFETLGEALKSLGAEILARYHDRGFKVIDDEVEPSTDKIDPTRFIAFVNSLLRGAWGDYGNPDAANGSATHWWPFTDFADVLTFKKGEVVTMQMMAAEVLLASIDKSLLTEFDVREICDNLPKIAKALNIKVIEEETIPVAIGMA
jgi:hypothetical protein